MRIPMYVQSTGRVFLAEQPPKRWNAISPPRHPYTPKQFAIQNNSRHYWRDQKAGFAWVFEEFEEGLSAVAAPVRDGTGRVAAVNLFGPSYRFPGEGRQNAVTEQVIATANQISLRLQVLKAVIRGVVRGA